MYSRKRAEFQRAQAARQASIDELALGIGERDAGMLANQRANAMELRVGELEIGNTG